MVMDQTSVEFKKVDVSSTFIENIFWSGLTLVSSNDIITSIKEIFFLLKCDKGAGIIILEFESYFT